MVNALSALPLAFIATMHVSSTMAMPLINERRTPGKLSLVSDAVQLGEDIYNAFQPTASSANSAPPPPQAPQKPPTKPTPGDKGASSAKKKPAKKSTKKSVTKSTKKPSPKAAKKRPRSYGDIQFLDVRDIEDLEARALPGSKMKAKAKPAARKPAGGQKKSTAKPNKAAKKKPAESAARKPAGGQKEDSAKPNQAAKKATNPQKKPATSQNSRGKDAGGDFLHKAGSFAGGLLHDVESAAGAALKKAQPIASNIAKNAGPALQKAAPIAMDLAQIGADLALREASDDLERREFEYGMDELD